MTRKQRTRNISFVIFGLVIVGAFSVLILLPEGAGTELSFTIPSLSVINATVPSGEVPVGDIVCKIRQITKVIGRNGQTLTTIESDTLIGSPTIAQLQFTDPQTQVEVSHFTVEPRILCTQENGVPIQVTSFTRDSLNRISELVISVNARFCATDGAIDGLTSSGGQTVGCTGNNFLFSEPVPIRTISFVTGSGEKSFGIGIVRLEEIEKFAFDEDLNTRLEFNVFGSIKIAYQDTVDCPNCSDFNFNFNVPFRTLNTFYDVNILKTPTLIIDTDGDGIIDSSDSCPTSPETFNGFEDTDGCPDVKPVESPPAIIVDEDPIEVSPTEMITVETDPIIITEDEEPTIIQSIVEPIQELIETLSEPTVADVTVEQITEPIVEPVVEPTADQPITQPSATQLPPIMQPAFELQQETPQPQQIPVRETIEIRPPMEDETFTTVIIILIIFGLIAVVVISRFTKIKI